MTVLFVTGTDTEVGKTIATAALVAALRLGGATVAVVKPAQTGVAPGGPGDLETISQLAGPVDTYEGIRLPDPLAPDRAAVLAGVALPSLMEQRDLIRQARAHHDYVLVEGAGGVTVRLGKAFTLLDLAEVVRADGAAVEWFVVVRAGLGTLNHSTLTSQAIESRRHRVAGLIIGAWPAEPDLAERHNRDDLPSYTGVPVIGAIPAGAGRFDPRRFQTDAPDWLPGLVGAV